MSQVEAASHVLTSSALLDLSPVVPVVVVEDAGAAVPLARALVAGGVRVIEITLRSEAAVPAIQRVAAEVPEIVVGAGTVTSAAQVVAVQRAGARFVVTPGSPSGLVDAVLDSGLPLLAGASTVTEMMRLADRGLTAMKLFPAEASGGRPYLSAVAGPCPQLRFCPTGGITPQTAADWLALPNVGCVGGSWLAPRDLVRAGDWAAVTRLAAAASALRVG
jgi:2-dehydro-3-deoxyphosphogluconate aldolase/(4S)-4-hydroxy-2-oxoglutarate aldolase